MGAGGSKAKVEPEPGGMGGGGSKPEPAKGADGSKSALMKTAESKLIFDAHCHVTGYMQESEGIDTLSKEMEKNGIGYAAITGCAFKKTWVGECTAGRPKYGAPVHYLYDDGDLYYFTSCDGNMIRMVKNAKCDTSKFAMLACGLNLGDYSCGELAKETLELYPFLKGFGEIVLQSDDINNVTIKGGNWTYTEPAVKMILDVCAAKKIPFVFYSDARSTTTKPYRNDFEYIDEIEMVCSHVCAAARRIWGCSLRGWCRTA